MNTAEDGLPFPQRYWAILTLVIGMVVSVLDSSIANIALPTIAREIGASPAQSIWVINAYQLAIVVSLLPLASLGDIFGYRRIYVIGLAVFSLAALVSALSHSLAMLAVGRALQGLGAAGMTSVNIALVRFTYPRRQLGGGIAMTAVAVSISSAAGPTVASAILAVASWPWLFAIDVPIGLVTLGLSLRLLPYTPPSPHRFDLMSALPECCRLGAADPRDHRHRPWPRRPGYRDRAFRRDARRVSAGAPASCVELAAAPRRSVPAPGVCALGHHLGVHLRRARGRLRYPALLFFNTCSAAPRSKPGS